MHQQRIEIIVPDNKDRERIDVFLARQLATVTRSQVQKLIQNKDVTVNGKIIKQNYIIRPLDEIHLTLPRVQPLDLIAEDIPLEIMFEDEYLIVVNKPAGMVVHPACGHSGGTLVNALLGHNSKLSEVGDISRPGIVHRIDKDTSGLLVIAKDNYIHAELAKLFSKKDIQREYISFFWGNLKNNERTVSSYIERHRKDRKRMAVSQKGKYAVTHFYVEKRFHLVTKVRCVLETGRTHQIRVHAAHIGHPVVGDQVYGGRGRNLGGLNKELMAYGIKILEIMERQALHAYKLGFVHPVTKKEIMFTVDLPEDMKNLNNFLENTIKGE